MRKSSPFLACELGNYENGSNGNEEKQNLSYDQVNKVLESVEKIKKFTRETEVLHKNALAEAKTEECIEKMAQVEKLVSAVLKEATETRKLISALQQNKKDGPEDAKVRSVSRTFLQAMRQFERVQEDYRERYRKQLERQYRLINPDGNQSDLNLAQLTESQTSLLLSQQIFRLSEDSRARRDLELMRQRNAEMHELEKGIEEVRVMFEEISVLVCQQGDLINKVEDYVVEISGDVKKANAALDKTLEIHKKKQAMRRVSFLISLTVLVFIFLVIIDSLFPNWTSIF